MSIAGTEISFHDPVGCASMPSGRLQCLTGLVPVMCEKRCAFVEVIRITSFDGLGQRAVDFAFALVGEGCI